jgi:ABC-2 type transport system permease protein
MKLWIKKGTWVMAGLVIVFIVGMMGLTKWMDTLERNEFGSVKTGEEVEVDWKLGVQEELEGVHIQLEQPNLEASEKDRLVEKEKILNYRLANSIQPVDSSSRESIIANATGIGGLVLLLTVIVAAGIVAVEFTQGTIKMLLTRPIKRWKILTSKYITVLLFGITLMLVGFVLTVICAYILFPSGSGQELLWNGKEVVEASAWAQGLYKLLLSFGNVIITATFAFMIGSVFRSNGLAIGLSLFIYFTGSVVVALLARYEIAKYLLFTHMDLTIYTTDFRIIEGLTLPFSLAVLAVYLVVFLIISYMTFTKRDITA